VSYKSGRPSASGLEDQGRARMPLDYSRVCDVRYKWRQIGE
jgi:hypothetical protein